VRSAQARARMRSEVVVVVVAGTERQKERVAEPALVFEVVAVLIAASRAEEVSQLFVLKIDAVDECQFVRRSVRTRVLDARETALGSEGRNTGRQAVARNVDLA